MLTLNVSAGWLDSIKGFDYRGTFNSALESAKNLIVLQEMLKLVMVYLV